jgi:NADH-quinone oxidoreductase subunit N
MATIVKAASFIAFIRLFENVFGAVHAQWQMMIALITAATLLIGNLTAVFQQSVKRMLAYSSIAQAGFMMLAIFALNSEAKEGLILYSAAYSLATIGIFGVLVRMNDYTVEGFNGMGKTHPMVAVCSVIFLLSLTGIPLTAGFQSKFYMLLAALKNGQQKWLVVFAVLMAAVSAYYYFRVIQAMFFKEPNQTEDAEPIFAAPITFGYKLILSLIALLLIVLGVMPSLLTDWLHY